jgi:hypothetical protein
MDFPLLDIAKALADADSALADILYYTQVLQADTEGQEPPEASTLLGNVVALRELLQGALPPGLVQAIAEEQALCDDEADRWDAASY